MKKTLKYSFDTYCDLIKLEAISEVLKNKEDIIEPISWIKLQQGGQGDIAVTHITLNSGIGKDREELNEQSFEIYADNLFPDHLDELFDGSGNENEKDPYCKLISTSDLDEEKKEELTMEWELPKDVLGGELWKCGHDIKKELIKAGFKVSDDGVVCYGDEDNTWSWKSDPYEEIDVIEYLNTEDLKTSFF